MLCFDQLRVLSQHLYEANVNKKCHLTDLYEIVQYSTSIVPRLYMMITVGSVLLRVIKEATDSLTELPKLKEVMTDLFEMSRGVQHPTRGLFLRYYLITMTRDYLPDTIFESETMGSIVESIQFILSNFVETNKLWVRMQYQSPLKDKEKVEAERRELKQLVGTNLVRLSQLDSMSLETYKTMVLPSILEEVSSCRDVIAQEYLMEVIVQVFQDEFHLQTLDIFLSATAKLESRVNIRQIVISLLDRFSNYAVRSKEESNSRRNSDLSEKQVAIPESIELFAIFWRNIMELINSRVEFSISEIMPLLVSLTGLALSCYSEKVDYVDQIFGFANERLALAKDQLPTDPEYFEVCRQLLLLPIQSYNKDILRLLKWPSSSVFNINGPDAGLLGGDYSAFLLAQPFEIRRKIAHSIMRTLCRANLTVGFSLDSVNSINLVFGELASAAVRDQPDHRLVESLIEWQDLVDEQHLLTKLIHTVNASDPKIQFQLLSTVCKHLLDGKAIRIRHTLPALVNQCIELTSFELDLDTLKQVYLFISSLIKVLSTCLNTTDEKSTLTVAELCVRLYLLAAASVSEIELQDLAYELFVNAMTVYEDQVHGTNSQKEALLLVIGYLKQQTLLSVENMETLVIKCLVLSTRLLKRADQVQFLLMNAHLFFSEEPDCFNDHKRVLDCLQKAIKLADTVMDSTLNSELFVEILESYILFWEKKATNVNYHYITSLIELVESKMTAKVVDEVKEQESRVASGIVHYSPISIDALQEQVASLRVSEATEYNPSNTLHIERHLANIKKHLAS